MVKFFIAFIVIFNSVFARPIFTPTIVDEVSLNIGAPNGWAVKNYQVTAGLKAVFWPIGHDPINTDIIIFVFIGNKSAPVYQLENMDPFRYKCPGMMLKKVPNLKSPTDNTLETYFSGRCGRGVAISHIDEGYYSLIILMVSSEYLTTNQLNALSEISKSYRVALVKAMGKDYFLLREDVNEAVRKSQDPDYTGEPYDPNAKRSVLSPRTVEADRADNNSSQLKTSIVLEQSSGGMHTK